MPKRVAIFCDFFNSLGGTEYYNFMLAQSIKKSGIDVKVFIGERPKLHYWLDLLEDNKIDYYHPEDFHSDLEDKTIEIQFIKEVKEIIKEWRPDIIHAHPAGKMIVSWFEAASDLEKEVPVIATEWTTPSKNTAHWYPKELKSHINKLNCIIATCNKSKEGIIDFFKYTGNVRVIPHLIKSPLRINSNNTNSNRFSVGCISRLSPEKGLDFLLGSWKKICADFPTATLHIYGHGNDENHLENLIKALGIEKSVFLEGVFEPIEGINQIAGKHDIFVQPSLFESIPTSIIELIARKKVIVATNVGGISELINSKYESGILINSASTDEIYEAISRLFLSPDYLKKISENAEGIFKERYSLEKNISEILNVYKEVM
ncbi:glycosyltransferase family 4 protein [Clostridium subterminale]|uniref:glycosyltransferase family 4 protein n=1 Tax=Clostridium subterminale TaxID=1550 RepID=UPI0031CEE8EC